MGIMGSTMLLKLYTWNMWHLLIFYKQKESSYLLKNVLNLGNCQKTLEKLINIFVFQSITSTEVHKGNNKKKMQERIMGKDFRMEDHESSPETMTFKLCSGY